MVSEAATVSDEQTSVAEAAPVATTPDLLELLKAGTAAVNLETAQPPPFERPTGMMFVGIANERVRRLYVFHRITMDEMKRLAEEANQIIADLLGGTEGSTITIEPNAAWFLDMMTKTGGRKRKAERLQTIEAELATKGELSVLAALHLWAEARMSFSILKKGRHADLFSDWSFGIVEGDESGVGAMLSSMLRGGGLPRSMHEDMDGFDVDSMFGGNDSLSGLYGRLSRRRRPTEH